MEKNPLLHFTEMSSEQLSTRILAEQSRIKSNDIRRGRISDEQFDKFIETSKNISELPLYIDETPAISIAAMSNRARRIKRIYGLDMIVVDYIQLMRGTFNNKDGRVQEISEITQSGDSKRIVCTSCWYLNYQERLNKEMIKNLNCLI